MSKDSPVNVRDKNKKKYIRLEDEILLRCCKCDDKFMLTRYSHLLGEGCPFCDGESKRMTEKEFIKRARAIHGSSFRYVEYAKYTLPNSSQSAFILQDVVEDTDSESD